MKPQNLLLPPQPTLRKWQRFLPFALPSLLL